MILCFLSLFSITANKTINMENKSEIYSIEAMLYDENITNTIKVFGNKMANSPFVRNIEIRVFDGENLLYIIAPKLNYGYDPKVLAVDFVGNNKNQIFYSASSGGSGGFGFFYIYLAEKENYQTLFDFETFSENSQYKGEFLDDYRAQIEGNGNLFLLDVSGMDEFYKNTIYSENGTVLMKPIDVSFLNTAFPFYNSSMDRWLLQAYQKATAVAQVNVLGYVVTNLLFEEGEFKTFWTYFSINPVGNF